MNAKDAAKYLNISEYYLRNMRHQMHIHDGPKCVAIKREKGYGIRYEYTKEDLDVWNMKHKRRK